MVKGLELWERPSLFRRRPPFGDLPCETTRFLAFRQTRKREYSGRDEQGSDRANRSYTADFRLCNDEASRLVARQIMGLKQIETGGGMGAVVGVLLAMYHS